MKIPKDKYNCTIQYYTKDNKLFHIALVNVVGTLINRASDYSSIFRNDEKFYTKEYEKHIDKKLRMVKDSDFQIVDDNGKSYFNYLSGKFEGLGLIKETEDKGQTVVLNSLNDLQTILDRFGK